MALIDRGKCVKSEMPDVCTVVDVLLLIDRRLVVGEDGLFRELIIFLSFFFLFWDPSPFVVLNSIALSYFVLLYACIVNLLCVLVYLL
jgi:hypothetical protein